MYKLLLLLAVIIGSVWLGLVIESDPGYVLFSYQLWSAEMPLWFLALLWLISLIVCCAILGSGNWIWRLPSKLAQWRQLRRSNRSQESLSHGFLTLMAGKWQRAERQLSNSASNSPQPVLNYLGAAFSAQLQGHFKQRDDYLRKAKQSDPDTALTVDLTQARLALDSYQYAEASSILAKLKQQSPSDPQLLRLLHRLYLATKNWNDLYAILPLLFKQKVLSSADYSSLEAKVHRQLFINANKQTTLAEIEQLWSNIPSRLRLDVVLVTQYAEKLIQANAHMQAERLLRKSLNHEWHSSWIALYGQVQMVNPNKAYLTAEKWLSNHEQDPELLFSLGQLAMQNKLWGKAQQYFEASLSIKPQIKTYQALVELLFQLKDNERAYHFLKLSLALAVELTSPQNPGII